MFTIANPKLTISEYISPSYKPRTYANARLADITVALAFDFNTAGEKLTKKAAEGRYIALHPSMSAEHSSGYLAAFIRERVGTSSVSINVAGNGAYTLLKHGISQADANNMVYRLLRNLLSYCRIKEIRSGGQTGVDLAGAVAGVALNIPTTLLLPAGFRQRHENGVDQNHTESEIRQQVLSGTQALLTLAV